MTPKQVAELETGDKLSFCLLDARHQRAEVGIVTANYIRVDWHVGHYDVLHKQSPIWWSGVTKL